MEPRFCVIFATKKSQATLSSIDFLQTDATYRLNWMGFPVFVFGECVLFILCMCIHISPRFLGLDSHGLHVIIIMHVFTVWSFGSPFLLNSYSQYLQCAFFTLMSSHHVEMQISLSSDYDFTWVALFLTIFTMYVLHIHGFTLCVYADLFEFWLWFHISSI